LRSKPRNNEQFTPFIALLVRLQPDDGPFFLSPQPDFLAVSRLTPSFAALRTGVFPSLCLLSGRPKAANSTAAQTRPMEALAGPSP
jgi:hypothetical protein